jgi:hypothetical protein
MIQRLYTTTALLLLPSAESLINSVRRAVARLDHITDLIERRLETEAVALGRLAHNRRLALESIQRSYDALDRKKLDSIAAARAKLDAAADARDRVAAALDL